ncbi:hypothetical protein LTR17_012556 [Elasticomyces elasticus]|nr:hypothetical protein LTR17_012556 [Elasticomyces elasticus]
MATFSTTDMFGSEAFSDVVIKYGDREFPAHKMILSKNSEYFKKRLEDKSVSVINLDDDGKPEAIEAMLRHLYGLKYASDKKRMDTSKAADVLRALSDKRHVHYFIETHEHEIIRLHLTELMQVPDFTKRFDEQPGQHLLHLLQMPDFAKRLDSRPGQAIAYLVQLAVAVLAMEAAPGYGKALCNYPAIMKEAFKKPLLEHASADETTSSPSKKMKMDTMVKSEEA